MKKTFAILALVAMINACDKSKDTQISTTPNHIQNETQNNTETTYMRLDRTLVLDPTFFVSAQSHSAQEEEVFTQEEIPECTAEQKQSTEGVTTFDPDILIACLYGNTSNDVSFDSTASTLDKFSTLDGYTAQPSFINVDFTALLDTQSLSEIIDFHIRELDSDNYSQIDIDENLSTAEHKYSYLENGNIESYFQTYISSEKSGGIQLEYNDLASGNNGVVFRSSRASSLSPVENFYEYKYEGGELNSVIITKSMSNTNYDISSELPFNSLAQTVTEVWKNGLKVEEFIYVIPDSNITTEDSLVINNPEALDYISGRRYEYDANNQLTHIYRVLSDSSEELITIYHYLTNGNIEIQSYEYSAYLNVLERSYDVHQRPISHNYKSILANGSTRENLSINIYNSDLNAVVNIRGTLVSNSTNADSENIASISSDDILQLESNYDVDVHFYQEVEKCGDYELLIAQSTLEITPRCKLKNDFPSTTSLPFTSM